MRKILNLTNNYSNLEKYTKNSEEQVYTFAMTKNHLLMYGSVTSQVTDTGLFSTSEIYIFKIL